MPCAEPAWGHMSTFNLPGWQAPLLAAQLAAASVTAAGERGPARNTAVTP